MTPENTPEVTNASLRAAIYCRLSEEDHDKLHPGDDSASITNQKALLLQYAASQGWEVVGVYSDDDYAGADRRRPAFRRLIRDAEARRFNVILCKSMSRFTREMELVEKYLHGLFPLWGIRFVSVADNVDTAAKGGRKARQISGLVNEWYLEDMSGSIRSVLDSRRAQGLHIGSFALFGYLKDPDHRGRLIIDREAAEVVREIFHLFASGMGKTAIARLLNERGVPNPTVWKRLHGLRCRQARPGSLWRPGVIASMLVNELYIGNMVQGRCGSVSYKTRQNRPRPQSQWFRVEGTHEPIIDRPLWDAVQALVAHRARPFPGGRTGLFAHKAFCAACGYGMRSCVSRGVRYLRCSCRRLSPASCPGAFISEPRLAQLVLGELQRLCADLPAPEELAQLLPLEDPLPELRSRLQAQHSAARRRAEEYARARQEAYLDKVRGLLSDRDWQEMTASFAREQESARRQALEAERRLAALPAPQEEHHRRAAMLARHLPPQRLYPEMVQTLVERVEVGRRIPGTRDVPVTVHWRF